MNADCDFYRCACAAAATKAAAATLRALLLIDAGLFFIERIARFLAESTGLIADSLAMFANAAIYGNAFYAVGRRASLQRRAARLPGGLPPLIVLGALLAALDARADDLWLTTGADGQPRIQLYFFWSQTCPHCLAAHPHVEALPHTRPWLEVQALEVSRQPDNVRRFAQLAARLGEQPAGVPSFFFCGQMMVGWDAATGMQLDHELDACYARLLAGQPVIAPTGLARGERIELPFFGSIETSRLSLPALTVVLAGLDAFNPCAFFVLLFLLSMMAHQKNRQRMLLIGGVFVAISGLMYFAFMAAWLNVFQLFGHLAWVTLAAGCLAVMVGVLNIKDFFWFQQGLSLSIPEAKKPELFRRARAILQAEHLPAMLAATAFLAIAANFYELLCTAGFPMVYTRLLTLADLSVAERHAWLAIYNLIYVLPLAAIVLVFARTLGARKLTEREGRLLKLLSGLMMLGLGLLLLIAPQSFSQAWPAFGLMIGAVGLTLIAARLTRRNDA